MKPIEFLRRDECEYPAFRARAAQFGNDVGVEQAAVHRTMSRTGASPRDFDFAVWGCLQCVDQSLTGGLAFQPTNSSAATTNTPSRRCTVTSCGPSVLAFRTSSEKRAFASCSSQPVDAPLTNRCRPDF